MSRRMFPGGDCGTRLCPTVLPTSSASQGEMEDSHHSSGRGAQRNICSVISRGKKSLLDDWSIIPPTQVYTSGCLTDREWAGPLSSDTEYCYCQEDKCNGQLQVGFLCSNNWSESIMRQSQVETAAADEERRKTNSTYNASSPDNFTDSLPHPIDTQLFYNLMKSGSSELISKASFMTLCIFIVAKHL